MKNSERYIKNHLGISFDDSDEETSDKEITLILLVFSSLLILMA